MSKEFWVVTIVLGIVTFGIRWSFLSVAGSWKMPAMVEMMMKYIPAAVFATLAIPALVFQCPSSYRFHEVDRLISALVGLFVAYKSKNVILTIAAGLGALWSLNALGF